MRTYLCSILGVLLLAACTQNQTPSLPLHPQAQQNSIPFTILAQADAALAEEEYAVAVALLEAYPALDPDRLAKAHRAWAQQLQEEAAGRPEQIRAAIDQLSLGLVVAIDTNLRAKLMAEREALIASFGIEPIDELAEPIGTETPLAENNHVTAERPSQPQAVRPTQVARPTVAPQVAKFRVTQRKSFEGSGNSGQFAACVDIQILDGDRPVSGAVIGINNGEHSYQNQTDENGYTGRCGLGASIWSVVLFWTPERGNISGATTTVYLNGSQEQRAAVVFQN